MLDEDRDKLKSRLVEGREIGTKHVEQGENEVMGERSEARKGKIGMEGRKAKMDRISLVWRSDYLIRPLRALILLVSW